MQQERDEARERGKLIYLQGRSPSGRKLTAQVSESVVVGADFYPCVQCHGEDGRGGLEAGVRIPEITWSVLTAADGALRDSGSVRAPYTLESLARAVREGLDPEGEPLDIIMPRYDIGDADLADLLAYLRVLGTETAPGTTGEAVTVGTLLPLSGARAEQGRAIDTILAGYFDEAGREAPINGRRIRYLSEDSGETTDSALAAAERLIGDGTRVFCVVAPAGAGADPQVLSFLAERGVPVIGPLTFEPDDEPSIFHVLPDFADQARAAARVFLRKPRGETAVVKGEGSDAAAMAEAFLAECREEGATCSLAQVPAGPLDAFVDSLRLRDVSGVALFGSPGLLNAFAQTLERKQWKPRLIASAILSGMRSLPYEEGVSWIAPPMAVRKTHPEGARFTALAREITAPGSALRMAAFAAAEIALEGLKGAGRDLSRTRLLRALTAIDRFETGVTPMLRYGAGRRRGLRGAVIVTPAAGASGFEWVDVAEDAASPPVTGAP